MGLAAEFIQFATEFQIWTNAAPSRVVEDAIASNPSGRARRWTKRRLTDVGSAQQLRHLGEARRHPLGLVLGEQLGSRAPTGLVLEIEIAQRLPGRIADNEAGVVCLIDRPWRREPAHGSDDSAISALPRKRRSAILRRRVAMGQKRSSPLRPSILLI